MPNSTERFSNRVANYVKYRPDYPPQVLSLFRDRMNLQEASLIADIGSGTGISAKIFLENQNKVYAIEPNDAMRGASVDFLNRFPGFIPIKGTAENTTLEDKSVDFIIAAQAFHWFDKAKTRLEFHRILRKNGFIALIWNERQPDSNEFLRDYERFLIEFGTDYQEVRHEKVTNNFIGDFFQRDFCEKVFLNVQKLGFEGLKGRMLSSSYMPSESHPRFDEMIKELQRLFAKFQKNDTIEIRYDTKVFYAQF